MIQSSGEFTTLETLQESTGWQTRRLPGEAGPPEEAPAPIEDHATTNDLVPVVPEGDAGLNANNTWEASTPGFVEDEEVQRLKELPKEVGVMLISVGVLGFVLPGVMGTPAIVAGGLVLWPKAFDRVENWFRRRHPGMHQTSMRQIGRFLTDMERRFPDLRKTSPSD
jgi:hypothetical protein